MEDTAAALLVVAEAINTLAASISWAMVVVAILGLAFAIKPK